MVLHVISSLRIPQNICSVLMVIDIVDFCYLHELVAVKCLTFTVSFLKCSFSYNHYLITTFSGYFLSWYKGLPLKIISRTHPFQPHPLQLSHLSCTPNPPSSLTSSPIYLSLMIYGSPSLHLFLLICSPWSSRWNSSWTRYHLPGGVSGFHAARHHQTTHQEGPHATGPRGCQQD